MIKSLFLLVFWSVAGVASKGVATVTADLSDHLIAITTAFTGTDVLLFGTVDEPVGDVVVTVLGPKGREVVRRKDRVGPIWLNTDQVAFDNVPFFYATASNVPLRDVADATVRKRHGIDLESLTLAVSAQDKRYDQDDLQAFRDGFIRAKQHEGLYGTGPNPLTFIGPNLFRSNLHFPANVQPGSYQVEVLHFREGNVVGAQRSALSISKVGVEAEVFDLAHKNAAIYGLACIVIAVAAGWTASAVFRRA